MNMTLLHLVVNRRSYFLATICARWRSSCCLSSGVNSTPKSSGSKIGRISTSRRLLPQVFRQSWYAGLDGIAHEAGKDLSALGAGVSRV
jgi:hypothetical protein